ncbi:hypothetical protein CI610_02570 [invertebrate metagenome]|uniref:Uncharacterized protein n=1 Tax=invertebrate metagenome TaxID=1711999 RepID=A0A2H9T5K1_9ZZZZ
MKELLEDCKTRRMKLEDYKTKHMKVQAEISRKGQERDFGSITALLKDIYRGNERGDAIEVFDKAYGLFCMDGVNFARDLLMCIFDFFNKKESPVDSMEREYYVKNCLFDRIFSQIERYQFFCTADRLQEAKSGLKLFLIDNFFPGKKIGKEQATYLMMHSDIKKYIDKIMIFSIKASYCIPPFYLDGKIPADRLFNNDVYDEYLYSGKWVDYVVWPAVRSLPDNKVMIKGVAEGIVDLDG